MTTVSAKGLNSCDGAMGCILHTNILLHDRVAAELPGESEAASHVQHGHTVGVAANSR